MNGTFRKKIPFSSKSISSFAIGLLLVLSILTSAKFVSQAHAAGPPGVSITFFHTPGAEAKWDTITPAPPGDPDIWSIKLLLTTSTTYAGFDINGVAGPPPPTSPTFDVYTTIAGASGGSPRLVMQFSDGGYIDLRPLSFTTSWQTVGDPNWDAMGGTCVFRYQQTYASLLALCHPGATVTSVYVVTDSTWLYSNGYTNFVDNIHYGSVFITSPTSVGAGCPGDEGNNANQKQHEELCEEKGNGGEQGNEGTEQGNEQAEQSQQNSDLSGKDVSNADFKGYDFSNSNLRGADFSGSDLTAANLSHADLTCASLAGANLSGANLAGAIFDGADLTGANLQGVDLTTTITTLGFTGCP